MRLQIKPLPQGTTLFTCEVIERKSGEVFGEVDIELDETTKPKDIIRAVQSELPRVFKVSNVIDSFTGEIVWST